MSEETKNLPVEKQHGVTKRTAAIFMWDADELAYVEKIYDAATSRYVRVEGGAKTKAYPDRPADFYRTHKLVNGTEWVKLTEEELKENGKSWSRGYRKFVTKSEKKKGDDTKDTKSYSTWDYDGERSKRLLATLPPYETWMLKDRSFKKLMAMLSYKRPAYSKSEKEFIKRFLKPLGCGIDEYGNFFRNILTKEGKHSGILWSSHTDTVHREGGSQKPILYVDGFIRVDESNCLGGDCTAGVWMMSEMIRAQVPGRYIFHRGEECGGLGSKALSKISGEKSLLNGIKIAIAFDRFGFGSVITNQMGGRCCSDVFADALAEKLGIFWHKDTGGTFTDTANYIDIVPECTNISIGYLDQHFRDERQHLPFLLDLRDKMVSLDFSDLPVVRDPTVKALPAYKNYYGYGGDDLWGGHHYADYGSGNGFVEDDDATPYRYRGTEGMLNAVKDHPIASADLLESLGCTPKDILEVFAIRQKAKTK